MLRKIDSYIIDGYFQPWSDTLHANLGITKFLSEGLCYIFSAGILWVAYRNLNEILLYRLDTFMPLIAGMLLLSVLALGTISFFQHVRWESYVGLASKARESTPKMLRRQFSLLMLPILLYLSVETLLNPTIDVLFWSLFQLGLCLMLISAGEFFDACIVKRPPKEEERVNNALPEAV